MLTISHLIKKGYRYRVGPYRFCKVLIKSEILKAAHDNKSTCTEVVPDHHVIPSIKKLLGCSRYTDVYGMRLPGLQCLIC